MKTTPHDRTVERLPWLVNGTLDADERREVEEHLADCADCRRELAATREAFDLYSAHLPPEVLLALAEDPDAGSWTVGGRPGEERGEVVPRGVVEAHLAHCADCREELFLVRESLAAMGEAPEEGPAPVLPFVSRERRDPGPAPAPRRWQAVALAASLLVALVTAGAWWVTSQQLDQRQARVEALEERLEELRQVRDRPSPADGAAVDPADVDAMEELVAELESRLESMERSLEGERRQVADLRQELATGRLPLEAEDVVIVEDVYQGVVRGDVAEGDEPPPAPVTTGDRRLVLFKIALEGEAAEREAVSYRLVDGGGTVLERGEAPRRPPRDAFASPYLLISLAPSALPAGELELQLLAADGERVVKRLPFRTF